MPKGYNEKFKNDALKLISEIGVSEASERLNVSRNTLYTWQRVKCIKQGNAQKERPITIIPHYKKNGKTLQELIKEILLLIINGDISMIEKNSYHFDKQREV